MVKQQKSPYVYRLHSHQRVEEGFQGSMWQQTIRNIGNSIFLHCTYLDNVCVDWNPNLYC